MASLTNIIRQVNNLIGVPSDIERSLEWSKKDLQSYLRGCISTQAFDQWHTHQLEMIQTNVQDHGLEELCMEVGTLLRPAIYKLYRLQSWAKSPSMRLPTKARTDRHLVISALQDILSCFKAFQDVKTRVNMTVPNVKNGVVVYLEKVYETMITLGDLLFPPRDDEGWFDTFREYLTEVGLRDFLFDRDDEYTRAINPTESWAIMNQKMMPENCLPTWPERCVRYQNPDPYGAPVLSNSPK